MGRSPFINVFGGVLTLAIFTVASIVLVVLVLLYQEL
jgi:hypothetical protein